MEKTANTTVTHSTGPPPDTWELNRATIQRLYLEEKKTLPQVMQTMKLDYGLNATVKMYKRRLRLWKMDSKNLRRREVKHIAQLKVERDAVGKASHFSINGRTLDMEHVQRYLKKHGFSSLQDLNRAASPVTEDADVDCSTPADLPLLGDNDGIEGEVAPQSRAISGHISSTEAPIIEWDALCVKTNPVIAQFLSFSPTTRSRRLLSLSPIPRALAPPTALLLPEQVLSMFSSYLSGSFQAGIWGTNKRGLLTNKNNLEQMGPRWSNDARVAVVLSERRSMYSLGRFCRKFAQLWN
jgi:hypothetical protein